MAISQDTTLSTDTIRESSAAFLLPAVITIGTAEVIAAEIREWAATPQPVLKLDASNIETFTTPGIQLLLALSKTLEGRNASLVIEGANNVLKEALILAGLETQFKEWEVQHG